MFCSFAGNAVLVKNIHFNYNHLWKGNQSKEKECR